LFSCIFNDVTLPSAPCVCCDFFQLFHRAVNLPHGNPVSLLRLTEARRNELTDGGVFLLLPHLTSSKDN